MVTAVRKRRRQAAGSSARKCARRAAGLGPDKPHRTCRTSECPTSLGANSRNQDCALGTQQARSVARQPAASICARAPPARWRSGFHRLRRAGAASGLLLQQPTRRCELDSGAGRSACRARCPRRSPCRALPYRRAHRADRPGSETQVRSGAAKPASACSSRGSSAGAQAAAIMTLARISAPVLRECISSTCAMSSCAPLRVQVDRLAAGHAEGAARLAPAARSAARGSPARPAAPDRAPAAERPGTAAHRRRAPPSPRRRPCGRWAGRGADHRRPSPADRRAPANRHG